MKKILAILGVYAFPVLAFAQAVSGSTNNVDDVINKIRALFNAAVPLIISLAIIYFLWYVFQYAIAGDEEKKGAAKSGMFYGIVAIAVMVSVWGLVNILVNTFGFSSSQAPTNLNNLLPTRN
jgi:hypothetical protein